MWVIFFWRSWNMKMSKCVYDSDSRASRSNTTYMYGQFSLRHSESMFAKLSWSFWIFFLKCPCVTFLFVHDLSNLVLEESYQDTIMLNNSHKKTPRLFASSSVTQITVAESWDKIFSSRSSVSNPSIVSWRTLMKFEQYLCSSAKRELSISVRFKCYSCEWGTQ